MDDLKIFEEQNGSLQEEYNAWRRHAERSSATVQNGLCISGSKRKFFRILQSERDNSFPCYVPL